MLLARTAAAALVLFPAIAGAELSIEGDATPWEGVERHLDGESQGRRGWYLEGGAAIGGCTGELCADVLGAGVGPGGRAGFGYRFAPLFSLGVSFDLQSVSAEGGSVGCADQGRCRVGDASASWRSLGAAARFHFVRTGALDPWVGFLAGAADASAEGERTDAWGDRERLEGTIAGGTLGLEAGVAWLPVPRFAVTLSGRFLYVGWTEACFESGATSTCEDASRVEGHAKDAMVTERDLPSLWSIALGVRGMP